MTVVKSVFFIEIKYIWFELKYHRKNLKFGGVKEYAKELIKVCATEKDIVQKLSE